MRYNMMSIFVEALFFLLWKTELTMLDEQLVLRRN